MLLQVTFLASVETLDYITQSLHLGGGGRNCAQDEFPEVSNLSTDHTLL